MWHKLHRLAARIWVKIHVFDFISGKRPSLTYSICMIFNQIYKEVITLSAKIQHKMVVQAHKCSQMFCLQRLYWFRRLHDHLWSSKILYIVFSIQYIVYIMSNNSDVLNIYWEFLKINVRIALLWQWKMDDDDNNNNNWEGHDFHWEDIITSTLLMDVTSHHAMCASPW